MGYPTPADIGRAPVAVHVAPGHETTGGFIRAEGTEGMGPVAGGGQPFASDA